MITLFINAIKIIKTDIICFKPVKSKIAFISLANEIKQRESSIRILIVSFTIAIPISEIDYIIYKFHKNYEKPYSREHILKLSHRRNNKDNFKIERADRTLKQKAKTRYTRLHYQVPFFLPVPPDR